MKIILLESVSKLGEKGEVREVKKGYFKNYLFPRGVAKVATDEEIARIEEKMKKQQEMDAKEIEGLKKKAEELSKKTTQIGVRLVAGRKIFGSVKGKEIAEKLGLKSKQIKIDKPIKEAGTHKIKISLGKGIACETTISIISKKKKRN